MRKEDQERNFYKELAEHSSYYSYHETENLLLGFAKEYAQIAIKSLFAANGGALFLLPPILVALKTQSIETFYLPAAVYSVGVFTSIAACLLAYFSTSCAFQTFRSLIEIDYKNLQLKHLKDIYDPSWGKLALEEKEKLEKDLKLQNKMSDIWSILGIIMAIISLSCFIFGTFSFLMNI